MRSITVRRNLDISSGGIRAVFLDSRAILLRFLAARRATPDEAEDVLQDLFLRLETHAVGPVAEPLPYLCRMADNLLIDRRRSAAARSVREEAWMNVQFGSEADDRPSAERLLISRERLAMTADALAKLPDRTVIIFRKFRIDGIPQREIAAELGISVSAVEKHLHKAYKAIVEAQANLDADSPRPLRS